MLIPFYFMFMSAEIADLYGACRKELLNFLFYRLRCLETAEDLVQESFLILARTEKTTRIDSPQSFLFKTASNLLVDYIRHHKVVARHVEKELPFAEEAQTRTLEQEVSELEWLTMLKKTLTMLPPRTRDIIILNRLHGQSYKQIADSLAISESAVEKHISRGLLHCRRELGPHFLNSLD
jgi:RNA polymerase sigma factor (sigma-70 family)